MSSDVQTERPVNGESEGGKGEPAGSPDTGRTNNGGAPQDGGPSPMKPGNGMQQQGGIRQPPNGSGMGGMVRSPVRAGHGPNVWSQNPRGSGSGGAGGPGGMMPPSRGYPDFNAGYGSGRSPYHAGGGGESLSRTNLYIRGLPPNTSDQDLHNMCQEFGYITSTKAIIDTQTTQCKGYGFVDFERPADAEKANQALQARGIQAQMAKFKERQPAAQEQDPTNLYVANLPDYVDDNYLESMVSPYGTVVSTRILRDPAGNTRGVGFCRMESREICEKIIQNLNKKMLPASKEPLVIKFADSGNKKRRELRPNHPMMMPPSMMAPGMAGRGTYPMANSNQNYVPNQVNNWNLGMYPQMTMSPVNAANSNTMDPNMLANQIGQMQISQNYSAMQHGQQSFNPMSGYQGQAGGMSAMAGMGAGMGAAGMGTSMSMVAQGMPYEMSTTPPQFAGQGFEDHSQQYQGFGQNM